MFSGETANDKENISLNTILNINFYCFYYVQCIVMFLSTANRKIFDLNFYF